MTETHCPYCSLQCGMRLSGRRVPEVSAWEEFPVNQGALCRKGWSAAGLYGSRERLHLTAGARPGDGGVVGRSRGTTPWTGGRRHPGRRRRLADRDAVVRCSVEVDSPTRRRTPSASSRGRARHLADRLQRSLVHVVGRVGGIRAFGLDRGLPFPLAHVEETTCWCSSGQPRPRPCRPRLVTSTGCRARGGKVVVIDRVDADCRPRRPRPPAGAGDRPRPGARGAAPAGASRASTRCYLPARTSGWETVRDSVAGLVARAVERVTGIERVGGAEEGGDARLAALAEGHAS